VVQKQQSYGQIRHTLNVTQGLQCYDAVIGSCEDYMANALTSRVH